MNLKYIINEDGKSVTIGKNTDVEGAVTIPAEVEIEGKKYSISGIGERAFYGCSRMESVTIAEGVTSIRLGKVAPKDLTRVFLTSWAKRYNENDKENL